MHAQRLRLNVAASMVGTTRENAERLIRLGKIRGALRIGSLWFVTLHDIRRAIEKECGAAAPCELNRASRIDAKE